TLAWCTFSLFNMRCAKLIQNSKFKSQKRVIFSYMRVILVIVFSFLSIGAFAQKKAKVSSRDTLRDVYKGVLPCADCSGLETELTLVHERHDGMGQYILKEHYIGRDSFETKGTWSHHRGMHGN